MTKEINRISLYINISNDKEILCEIGYRVTPNLSAADAYECACLVHGLASLIENYPEFVSRLGHDQLESRFPHLFSDDDDDDELVFEPADELKEALGKKKVVPFNKNKLN